MSRPSKASLSVIQGSSPRLEPPTSLSAASRSVFLRAVNNNAPEFFNPSDMPLLVAYAEAVVRAAKARRMLDLHGEVDEKRGWPSAWFTVLSKSNADTIAFGRQLRLAPQSRMTDEQARRVNKGRSAATKPHNDRDALMRALGVEEGDE